MLKLEEGNAMVTLEDLSIDTTFLKIPSIANT